MLGAILSPRTAAQLNHYSWETFELEEPAKRLQKTGNHRERGKTSGQKYCLLGVPLVFQCLQLLLMCQAGLSKVQSSPTCISSHLDSFPLEFWVSTHSSPQKHVFCIHARKLLQMFKRSQLSTSSCSRLQESGRAFWHGCHGMPVCVGTRCRAGSNSTVRVATLH